MIEAIGYAVLAVSSVVIVVYYYKFRTQLRKDKKGL